MTRYVKIAPTKPEEPKPLTLGDLPQGTFFMLDDGIWRVRTDLSGIPSVRIDGNECGCTAGDAFKSESVSRVLAPGESLTIGPDE